ncbi:MAG TPA: amidohydrolase family protein, partial [Gemmatimonadales bacterium]|nr:amidohydrolase family protein [Gemmatimonadales bacterium]
QTLALLDAARQAGQDVMADAYPYDASSTSFNVLVPAWAMAGGDTAFARRVKNPVLRDSIIKGIIWILDNDRGGGDLHRPQFASVAWKPDLNGKTLYDWAVERKVPPTSAGAAPLVIEGVLKGGASMVFHVMDEGDVQRILKHPWVAIASDGALSQPGPTVPHPRNYGTFPRVLGRYVRELHVLTLPDAVRKMTSLPAARLGLTDRGRIAAGLLADLVVFDPATVADRATYEQPHQYPVGIDYVVVNGQVEVDGGKLTAVRAGRIIKHIPKRGPVAFQNVNVIPMDGERVLAGQTVVVRDDKIVALGPTASVAIPAGAVRIDGAGKYLIPGLGEMHAHIPPTETSDSEIVRTLALWALNGVTTIRGMLGTPRHLYYRELARSGELVSPRIWTSGPSFNDKSAPSADSAVRMVNAEKALGYDFLKIHPGVPRDAFDSIAADADHLGIRFAGHVPLAVGLPRALEAKYWSIDHLDGFIEALSAKGPPATAKDDGFFGLPLIGDADTTRIPALVAATRAAGTWIVPTQAFFESVLGGEAIEELFDRAELRYVPRDLAVSWVKGTRDIREDKTLTPDMRKRFLAVRRQLLKALQAGGVGIVLGSDSPQYFNAPGFSLVRELQSYVAAGLTPYQALATGTSNVARFLGNQAEAGSIAVGKRADLILLDANPLKDIANVGKQSGVLLGGHWLPKEEIQRQLATLIVR